jgi:hypothetical protein
MSLSMDATQSRFPTTVIPIAWSEELNPAWEAVKDEFLRAVPPRQRAQVAELLHESDSRGRGLRTWLRVLAANEQRPADRFPAALVQVYLDDDEAMPLHDCAVCGVAIPVRPDWYSFDGEPQQVYFPECPCCGGRTGLYAAWSRGQASLAEAAAAC